MESRMIATKKQILETLNLLSSIRLNRSKTEEKSVNWYISNLIALQTYEDLKKKYSNA